MGLDVTDVTGQDGHWTGCDGMRRDGNGRMGLDETEMG